jgi:hypothetical protein
MKIYVLATLAVSALVAGGGGADEALRRGNELYGAGDLFGAG